MPPPAPSPGTTQFIAPFGSYVAPVHADLKYEAQTRAAVSPPLVVLPTTEGVATASPPRPPRASPKPTPALAAPHAQASCVFVVALLLVAAAPKLWLWSRGSITHPSTTTAPMLLETHAYAHKLVAANMLLAETGWQLVEPDGGWRVLMLGLIRPLRVLHPQTTRLAC